MLNALGKGPSEKPCNTIDTLVGAKSELKGDILFSGGLRIDGKVKGNVTAKGEANSTLVLSEHAVVICNITVPHVISNGTIKGIVRASERVELQPHSEIAGDVHYKVIEMAFGAVVNGNLIREVPEDAKDQGNVPRLKPVAVGGEGENAAG